jgi:DNA-binding CsgD family transcriptional regulator
MMTDTDEPLAGLTDEQLAGLTDRDREVLTLTLRGRRQAQIAAELKINKQRVSAIVKRLIEERGIDIPKPRRGQPRKTPQ